MFPGAADVSWWSALFHPERRRFRPKPLPPPRARLGEAAEAAEVEVRVPPVEPPAPNPADEVEREREPPILGLSTLSIRQDARGHIPIITSGCSDGFVLVERESHVTEL